MDPRLLEYYNRELQHVRDMGGEFAREFPKIAGRLGLDEFECADPYVERLLEGFAFLAARVQLKLDAQFPRFTEHLLEIVYPHFLAPTPSMAVVQFQPDLTVGSLADGFSLPRHTVLRSALGKGEQTACTYRTAHDVTLWPLELVEAEYFSRDMAALDLPSLPRVQAGLRFRLQTTAGLTFRQIRLDRLPLYIRGAGDVAMRLYEQLRANVVAVVIQPAQRPAAWREQRNAASVRGMGFSDNEALLPYGERSFHGYRLLQEYFAFPNRFLFVELTELASAAQRCAHSQLDVFVLLDRSDRVLENRIDAAQFALYCSPAINLFPKRTDRIHLNPGDHEHHVVPDRTRPMDFEVHSVTEVTGHTGGAAVEQEFLPFYQMTDWATRGEQAAFYTVQRKPRVLSARQRREGSRTGYVGSEVFLSLVDGNEAPYRSDLRQLGANTLATNRDLPLQMSIGQTRTDFSLEASAPVHSVRCVAGPTRPRPSPVHQSGELAWRLISHLSLNYLSLVDNDAHQGAAALREMLALYGDIGEAAVRKQIEGLRSVESQPILRRVPRAGPIAFARGVQIRVTFDEETFEGTGVFLLGAILDDFFARYCSINSFTETVIATRDRGEIKRWPTRIGRRHTL